MSHTLAQFALDALAFLVPHLVEPLQRFADLGHHSNLDFPVGSVVGGIERTRNAQNCVEIGLGGQGKFGGRGSEGRNISANEFTIKSERLTRRALQAQRYLNVAARNLFLEQAAELHFKRVGPRR